MRRERRAWAPVVAPSVGVRHEHRRRGASRAAPVRLEELLRVAARVDVDLSESVVQVGILVALVVARLEPRQHKLEAIARLALLDELLARAVRPDGHDELLDDVLRAVVVEQRADDLGRARGVDLLHVDLDVLNHVVLVQVLRQLLDVVVPAGVLASTRMQVLGGTQLGYSVPIPAR